MQDTIQNMAAEIVPIINTVSKHGIFLKKCNNL